jgi:hypothetical protein
LNKSKHNYPHIVNFVELTTVSALMLGHLQVTRCIFEETIQCESQDMAHESKTQKDLIVVQFSHSIHNKLKWIHQ